MARLDDPSKERPVQADLHHIEISNADGRGYTTTVKLDGQELHVKRIVVSIEPRDWVTVTMELPARVDIEGLAQVKVQNDVLVMPRPVEDS